MLLSVLAALVSSSASAQSVSMTGTCPLSLDVQVDGITPSGQFALLTGVSDGFEALPAGPCAGLQSGLAGLSYHGLRSADANGSWNQTPVLQPVHCQRWIQVLDIATCRLSFARSVAESGVGVVRLVHLIPDVPAIDIHVNGAPVLVDLPYLGNTDFAGGDYAPFPAADYLVEIFDSAAGALVHSAMQEVWGADYATTIYFGTAGAGTVDVVVRSDDVAPQPPGTHRLSLLHTDEGLGPAQMSFAGGDWTPPIAYGSGPSTKIVPAGPTSVDLDLDGDAVADISYTLDLDDGAWSYAYLARGPLLVHHVRGADNLVVSPDP